MEPHKLILKFIQSQKDLRVIAKTTWGVGGVEGNN